MALRQQERRSLRSPCHNAAHPARGQFTDQATQILEVPRQAIHAMDYHGVAIAYEGQQRRQLRTLGILGRHLIGKDPVDRDRLELTFRALIEHTNAYIADALSLHTRHWQLPLTIVEHAHDLQRTHRQRLVVKDRLSRLHEQVSRKSIGKPNITHRYGDFATRLTPRYGTA
jgi:hypothetical protein